MEERQRPVPSPISGFVFEQTVEHAACPAGVTVVAPGYSLNNRRFVMAKSSEGRPRTDVTLSFRQTGAVVSGDFCGGDVMVGQCLGRFVDGNHIELHFHFLSSALTLHSGTGSGLVCGDPANPLTLFLNWRIVSGGIGQGAASYKEI